MDWYRVLEIVKDFVSIVGGVWLLVGGSSVTIITLVKNRRKKQRLSLSVPSFIPIFTATLFVLLAILIVISLLFPTTAPLRTSNLLPTVTTSSTPAQLNITDGQKIYNQIVGSGKMPDWGSTLQAPDANGWTVTSGKYVGCQFHKQEQGQKGYYEALSYLSGYMSMCFADKSITDGVYQVHMTVQDQGGGGIIIRAKDKNWNSAMLLFNVLPRTQTFEILAQPDDARRISLPCASLNGTKCTDSSINKTGGNTLAVLAEGHILYFYINGTCVAGVFVDTSNAGYIGVFGGDQPENSTTDIMFDSARVWIMP